MATKTSRATKPTKNIKGTKPMPRKPQPDLYAKATTQNDVTQRLYRFNTLIGGVIVAYPCFREPGKGKTITKNRHAVVIRLEDEELQWEFYNQDVTFVLFTQDEKQARYCCRGHYQVGDCRIIRDADDLPEAIAAAAADLWKKQ